MLFELRDALRRLVRSPAYSLAVVVTLALAIGATTAVFSIVNGVLLEPLPYRHPDRLVQLRENWRELPEAAALPVNERHFEYWREHAHSFDGMAQYILLPGDLTGAGDAMPATIVYASGSLFDVLGIDVALGRGLTIADEPSGASDVVVVSHPFWRERLRSDPAAIGRSLAIDGRTKIIAGVLPSGLELPAGSGLTARFDAIAPLHMDRERVGWAGDHNNQAVGRLREATTVVAASAELDVLQTQVSVLAARDAHEPVTLSSVVVPLGDSIVGRARRGLWLLLAAIVAVLLMACANLASLALARTLLRIRDAAIRTALGASRARLAGAAALETLLLAAAGGGLGLWVAWLGLKLFVRTAPVDLPRAGDAAINGRVLLFATAVTIACGAFVGAVPAWRAAGGDVERTLRSGGAAVASSRGGLRARGALVGTQVCLSVMLLAVTGLLAVSLWKVLQIDRGFSPDRVVAVQTTLPASHYTGSQQQIDAIDRVLAAVRQQPGVLSASTTSMLPLTGEGQINFIVPAGGGGWRSDSPSANFRFVASDFFRTLGVPLLRGRTFTDGERDVRRPLPVVVSVSTARRLWSSDDALGRRFSRGIDGEQGFEVVGIAADARTTSIERTPPLMVYVPFWWRSRTSTSLLVKSAATPDAVMPAIRRAVQAIDPEIALGEPVAVQRLVERATAARRYQASLFVAFGIAALVIAIVGVYAVTAFGVSGRRREMNIRAALGASRGQVLRMVVRQGSTPIVAGIGAGIAGALAGGRFAAALLYEVRPRDPAVLAAVTMAVSAAALGACLVAARRSLTIDPAAALRE